MKKTIIRSLLIVLVAGGSVLEGRGEDGPPQCPKPPDCDSETPPCDCPDPAFLGVDRKPGKSLEERKAELAGAQGQGVRVEFSEAEKRQWEEVEQRLSESPEQAYEVVESVWAGNHSISFQKQVILKAQRLVQSTDESANLSFMLLCLENADRQREEALKLGSGNGLERQKGARQLALLEKNPCLASPVTR